MKYGFCPGLYPVAGINHGGKIHQEYRFKKNGSTTEPKQIIGRKGVVLVFKNSQQISTSENDGKNTKRHKAPNTKKSPGIYHIEFYSIPGHENKPAANDNIPDGFIVKINTIVYKTPKADINKRKNIVKNIWGYAPPVIGVQYNDVLIYNRQRNIGEYSK